MRLILASTNSDQNLDAIIFDRGLPMCRGRCASEPSYAISARPF